MEKLHGLTETQQSLLMFITVSLITLNIYIATIEGIPDWVIAIFGALSAVSVVAKEQYGARKSEISETTKSVIGAPK